MKSARPCGVAQRPLLAPESNNNNQLTVCLLRSLLTLYHITSTTTTKLNSTLTTNARHQGRASGRSQRAVPISLVLSISLLYMYHAASGDLWSGEMAMLVVIVATVLKASKEGSSDRPFRLLSPRRSQLATQNQAHVCFSVAPFCSV